MKMTGSGEESEVDWLEAEAEVFQQLPSTSLFELYQSQFSSASCFVSLKQGTQLNSSLSQRILEWAKFWSALANSCFLYAMQLFCCDHSPDFVMTAHVVKTKFIIGYFLIKDVVIRRLNRAHASVCKHPLLSGYQWRGFVRFILTIILCLWLWQMVSPFCRAYNV